MLLNRKSMITIMILVRAVIMVVVTFIVTINVVAVVVVNRRDGMGMVIVAVKFVVDCVGAPIRMASFQS